MTPRVPLRVPPGVPLRVPLRVPSRVPLWVPLRETYGSLRVVLRVMSCVALRMHWPHAHLVKYSGMSPEYATSPGVPQGCSRVTMQSTMCSSWCGPRVLRVDFSKVQVFFSA